MNPAIPHSGSPPSGINPKSDAAASNGRLDGFFLRLVSWSTAMAFAGMLGTLACMSRGANGKLTYALNLWILPWAALGFTAGLYFWRLLWQAEAETNPAAPARQRLIRYSVAMGIGAFVSFVYPIRFVDPTRRTEVLLGLGLALTVLSFMGWLIFNAIRWVSANELKDGECELPEESRPVPTPPRGPRRKT